MEYFAVIERRQSIRSFRAKEVEAEKLQAILQCAQAAPSAGNLQAYRILVVKNPEGKRALRRAALDQEFIDQAPVVLVFFQDQPRSASKYGGRGSGLYSIQDATIACAYAQLAAAALGLSSCWVGAFHPEPVARLANGPAGLVPIALLPIGYAAEKPERTGRRPSGEVLAWESF
ncbi:MAG: nitroreductase family protein [Planctomycetes bacterium]|nr:nitroreductase family protein [Planctomycetota bacterium]